MCSQRLNSASQRRRVKAVEAVALIISLPRSESLPARKEARRQEIRDDDTKSYSVVT
jgi:hypothetical protein